jgi:hypothetical protein
MNRTRFAVAIAVVCVACVKVPDDIKATFAPGRGGSEPNNFSKRSPHTIAPPELTEATVPIADASTSDASASPTMGVCPREETTSAMTDAGAGLSSGTELRVGVQNCLQDAGNP